MNEVERFKSIKEDIDRLSGQKIRLDERYQNQRQKLDELLKEIAAKGFDPQKLSEIREEKETELKKLLDELEQSVQKVEEELKAIEA
jgi:hypothetical protein